MAKQFTNREKLAFTLDHLSESEIDEIVEYVSMMETTRHDSSPPDFDDELIASLSAAYENRRAQQAFEWDAVRQRAGSIQNRARAARG
jgi:hypothetical protein